jgi:hypothetical protein
VAVEARHHNIGDDEMNGVGVVGGDGERGFSLAGFEDAIAAGR